MAKQVLVTGASGFVGSHLAEALEARGHSVLAMTRHPDTYAGAGKPIFGDVYDADSVRSALADVDAAYYLVHSLARQDFVEKDAEAALEVKAGGGAPAGNWGRTGHGAAGGNHYWTRQHFVGDHPAAGRSPSSDGCAQMGDHPHPADRPE